MLLAKNKLTGNAILLRCGCSHSWSYDRNKYDHPDCTASIDTIDAYCPKCGYFAWTVQSLTVTQLIQRDHNMPFVPTGLGRS